MESEHQEFEYSFLSEENVEKHFADLNIKLLSGRHIHSDDYLVFSVLEDHYTELKSFYKNLYKLDLIKGRANQDIFFYLDFFDGSKGKLVDPSRHKTLTVRQTLMGLMLLDLYYFKYFNNPKTISWTDFREQILSGDHSVHYKRILFAKRRQEHTDAEWEDVERHFRKTLIFFEKLGWVKRLSDSNTDLLYEIKPAIQRFVNLYQNELEHFDVFLQKVKQQTDANESTENI